jgi:dTDP-4-dehydrorhamnose reductase
MSLKGIIAVGGMSGLYKVISQTKTGFIVESLNDQKKTIIQSTQKVSTLEDISIYTASGEKPLKDVLILMKEKENIPVNPKSEPAELKKYFKTIVPDFDEERVYASDIKKIISWYQLLKEIVDQKDEEAAEKVPGETKAEPDAVIGEDKSPGKTGE